MAFTSIFTFLVAVAVAYSYETGAPTTTCTTMTPGHGSQPNQVSPYTIKVSGTKYSPGGTLTVNVEGGDYKGIILQARTAGTQTIVGKFSSPAANSNAKVMQCMANGNTITHSSQNTKNATTTFTWTAPSSGVGNVEFVATVAQQMNTWWRNVKSTNLALDTGNLTQSSTTHITTNGTTITVQSTGSVTTMKPSVTTTSNGQKSVTDIFSFILALGFQMFVAVFLNKL